MKLNKATLVFATILGLTISLGRCPSVFASPIPPAGLPDLVEKVLPGVVNISSTTVIVNPAAGMNDFFMLWGIPQERKQTSLGTGFIIDRDGFILTNNHVVMDATEVVVTLLDKRQFHAKIIGKDQKLDLALLQIRGSDRKAPSSLTPVSLGDSNAIRIAESVFAVGNPFGLQHTVTLGIISAKNRTIGQGPFDNFLQTDASINPGNSGGPLFNTSGEVIGINTMIFSRTGQSGGLGFAIPVNEAKSILSDLKKYGRVPRPWLGIRAEKMTTQLQQYYHLGGSKGVLVYDIAPDGPAGEAGLAQGDIIIQIAGNEVSEPNDVERELAKLKPTDSAQIRVLRGRTQKEIQIQLEELPKLDHLPAGII